ncbi:MAG: mannose-1-phosphate guanylyltransferase, partial [Bacteroidota bacterium]|nr:mannose-1-phosphate guanylyltransferase [Bacteroidota bacterium]
MENNYCVIMSGGIGSRFWPASRTSLPKQFLDFFGTGKSLLQQTVDRFRRVLPAENIYIVTNQKYKELTMSQLPEINENQILLEPQRRNTAPCIAFAANRILAVNSKANIVVAPSDHLILKEADFLDCIREGLDFVASNNVLLTIGIKPNRPETGYGYIQLEAQKQGNISKVKTFTEKPNAELAQVFLESREFLWNSGIFMWNVQTILSAFDELLPE